MSKASSIISTPISTPAGTSESKKCYLSSPFSPEDKFVKKNKAYNDSMESLDKSDIMERLDCLIMCTFYSPCTRVILLCTNVNRYVQNAFRYEHNVFRYVHNVFRYAQNIFRYMHNVFRYVHNVFRYVH